MAQQAPRGRSWTDTLIIARFIVASLGEQVSPQWWRTNVTTEIGQQMLIHVYPRTALIAGLEIASRAARREHDEHVGIGNVYHLFRLPTADELAIYDRLHRTDVADLLGELLELKSDEVLRVPPWIGLLALW